MMFKFKKNKKIIIIGIGRLGSNLAGILNEKGCEIIVVDKDERAFLSLSENFEGREIIADATDLDTLRLAGIENAYKVIVVTEDDNVNSMIGQMANKLFHVENVYIRLNDTSMESIFAEEQIKVISPLRLSISEFERLNSQVLEGSAV